MDFITHCYRSQMRLYRDRPDVLVWGRWHWCPPGARAIPYFHLFGSHTLDSSSEVYDPPVGEVPRRRGRTRGEANPRYTGQHFCGTEEDWTEGPLYSQRGSVPVDEEGVPICCHALPAQGGGECEGGALPDDGGDSMFMAITSLTPDPGNGYYPAKIATLDPLTGVWDDDGPDCWFTAAAGDVQLQRYELTAVGLAADGLLVGSTEAVPLATATTAGAVSLTDQVLGAGVKEFEAIVVGTDTLPAGMAGAVAGTWRADALSVANAIIFEFNVGQTTFSSLGGVNPVILTSHDGVEDWRSLLMLFADGECRLSPLASGVDKPITRFSVNRYVGGLFVGVDADWPEFLVRGGIVVAAGAAPTEPGTIRVWDGSAWTSVVVTGDGDLDGAGDLLVTGIRGRPVESGAPADNDTLVWDALGGEWVYAPGGGGGAPVTERAFVPPVDGDFSWVNQGGASVDTTLGGIFLTAPSDGGAYNVKMRVKSYSTPIKVTVRAVFFCVVRPLAGGTLAYQIPLVVRDSSSGELTAFGSFVGDFPVDIIDFTAPNAFSAQPYVGPGQWNYAATPVDPLWWQFEDDGTDHFFRVSNDGWRWHTVLTRSRTAFLGAPDEVGFAVAPYNNAAGLTVWSWEEE